MLARVRSAAVLGIDAYLVDFETGIANGLPTFATVGLPHGAVKEGRERVYSAIANTGYTFLLRRIQSRVPPRRRLHSPRTERIMVTPPSAPSAQSVQTKKKPPVDVAISG